MPVSNMGLETSLVSSSAYAPLGFRFVKPASLEDNEGEKEWVYIFNDHASDDLTAGAIAVRDPSATTYAMYGVIPAAAATLFARPLVPGVAQHTIGEGEYGFIQSKGKGLVQCGTANISADTAITSGGSGAGDAIDFADGAEEAVIGMSLEAETTDNTTFDAFILASA